MLSFQVEILIKRLYDQYKGDGLIPLCCFSCRTKNMEKA